jgi:hypothetical protein
MTTSMILAFFSWRTIKTNKNIRYSHRNCHNNSVQQLNSTLKVKESKKRFLYSIYLQIHTTPKVVRHQVENHWTTNIQGMAPATIEPVFFKCINFMLRVQVGGWRVIESSFCYLEPWGHKKYHQRFHCFSVLLKHYNFEVLQKISRGRAVLPPTPTPSPTLWVHLWFLFKYLCNN